VLVGVRRIVIGSIQDLSGPIAVLGKPVQNGMILRTDRPFVTPGCA